MSDLDFEFFATYKGKHYAGLRYCEIDEYVKAAHAKVFLRAARLEENDGKHAKVKLKFVFPPKMQIEKTNTLTFLKIVKPLVGQWYEKQNTGTAKNCEHYELFRVLTDVREFIHRNTRWNVNPVKLDDSFDSLRQIKTLHDFEFGILAIEAYFSQFGGRYEKMGGNYEENRKFIRLLRESMDKKESELSKTEPDKQKERLLVQAYRKWKRQAEISTTPSKDSFEWISSDMIAFVNNYQNRYDETLQRRVDGIKKTAIDFSIPASDILAEFFTHRSTSWRDTMLKWLEGDKRTDVLRFIRKLIIGVIEEEPAGVPISSFIFAWGLANSKEVDHYQTASLVVFQGLLDPSQISSIMKPSDLLQINIWVLKFVLRDDSKTALDLNTAVLLTFFQADAKMATKCFDEHCKLFFSEVKEREAYLQSWLKRLLTSDRLTFDVHDKILVQVAEFVGEPQLYLDVQSHWRNLLIGRSTKERVQYLARIIELLIKRDRLVNNYQYLLASTVFEDHQYIMYPQMAEFFEGCPQSMNFLLQARHDSIKNRDQALSTIFSLLAKDDVQQLLEIGRYMRVYFTSDQTLKGSIEVREFLHKLVDDFQRFNIPLKYVATLLRKDDRGQIDHCIDEKKAQLLSELLANITQLTNADYYQKATHEDDVKKTVTKLAETLINIRFEAQACSSQILLPSHGLIERFTEVKEFQVLLKIFETPGESMKVLGELVKSFEWQTGIKPESLKIFNQKIDDDRFFSAILVVLATKLARIAKKDLSESVKNLASIRCQSVLADVIKQLSKSSRSTDSQSRSNIVDENLDIQFPLFLSARLQETAVRIFEDLADSLLSSSTPELQTLAKLILSDQALQASFRYPKASFQRFQTKQTLDQLCSNDFRRLAELQNAKWLDDEELLDALAAFLNEYKNAKLEPKTPLTLASSLIEAKKFAKSKGRFHQERKDLAEQILPVLVAFSDGRKDLKEFNKVYGVLAEARDLSNRRLDELMLDSNELNQYDLTVHDIAALKACKTALHTSKTWSDLFAGLLVPSNADISCAKSLQDKHQELQTFLKLYKANQAGSEQKKTDDILRILEGADICFYKSHEATEYSLHVFITSAKDSQFDLGKSLEHNLQLDRQMQLEERKTERSNVVDHGAFSAMKAKAAFLLSLHKSSDLNNFEYFYDLATQALEVLVLANSLESSHLVVDFQDALFANFGNELKKCGIRLVIGEDFRSIQVSTRDKQQVMSLALKSLRGYTFELATLSEEAKKTVFHSKRLAFYPWSCFQARHICLVEKFLKSLERADHTTLPDLRRKVQLLFKHAGSSISLDRSDAEMVKVFNKLHGYITYSLLVNLNEVFGISPQTPRRALSPRKSAKSCFLKVLFDQENRIPTLLAICRQRDSEGIEASPRIMFCSPFTSWSEIEVFLLQAIFDLEDRKYTIADSHLLEVEVRHRMLADLEAKAHLTDEHVNYNVCLMAPTKHPSRLAEELADRYQKQFKLTPVSKQGDWKACISKVLLVKSDFAGLGKTHFIEKDAEKSGFKLLVLNLSGQMSPKLLTKRLKPIFVALERSQMSQPLALRLKLDIADDVVDTFHYLDQLLFKICVLQVVEFGSSFLGFERVAQFYIEVQNTLDNRLLKVDFVRFLTKIEGCCISLQPPFRKQLPGLSGGNLEEGDQTSDLLLVDGPNRLDLHYLFRFGLLDSLLLHTLFKQPLIENMVYHKFGQEETLIHYINPAQIIRPLIQDAISREVHYRPDDSEELNSLMQAKPGVLASKLSHLEQKIVVAAAKKRTEIERLLKSAEREFKSSLAYSKIYWLIKSIYSPQELDKSVLESKILSSTTKEERWLLLLAEAEDHFTVKYSGLEDCRLDFLMRSPEGARAIHQEKEARANIVQCIDELLLDLKEESEMPLKYEDVNYYHLKTLIQLVSQFVHQLNRSDSLDISTMKNSSIGPIRDTNITGPTAFRFKLVTKSLEQIRRFAFQQIISVSWLQRQNRLKMMKTSDRDGEAAYLRVLEQLKQQAACHNHWFFLHDGVLKLVHNDDSRLDSDLVGFYYSQMRKPQTLNAEKSQEQYVQELCEAFGGRMTPDQIEHSKKAVFRSVASKNKRFMITADNYLKMRLILQRAEVGIPIILLGESGCGKTFMLEFLAEQRFEQAARPLRTLTFHSGVGEDQFATLIRDCIKEATQYPDCRLWLFLDEINTTPLLPCIAELITERRAHFLDEEQNTLPSNVVIVAACNPYQVARGPSTSTGQSLIHKVYPLPENLISFCFNYGQLSEKDEKAMIKTIIEDSKIQEIREAVESLTDCLSYAQVLIRKYENESAASLRDVRRFVDLLRALLKRGVWEVSICVKLAIYCCYSIRVQPHEQREGKKEVFNHQIEQILADCPGLTNSNATNISELFTRESSALLNEAKDLSEAALLQRETVHDINVVMTKDGKEPTIKSCFEGIAINRPLLENVFILLHCFLARIPIYICGRPGTSKSVSIQVVDFIFNLQDTEKAGSKYFKGLPQANFYPIWGSKDTTAKHVKDEFERVASIAKKAIERERENKQKIKEGREKPHLDTIRVIYFEEMGVADTNDNNPLKVLHPLLEPREQDRVESLCFVGLSNTSLDAAKLNRLLNVPRFDMDDSELQATVDHYNIDLRIENILTFESDCETFKDATKTTISTALVEAYRQFREYEQASPYHRDFHGPRDFYAMCKWTSSNLDTLDEVYKEQGRGESAKSWIQMMLSYFLLAIERNFSGRELPTNPAKTLDIGDIYQKNSCGIFKQLFLRQLLANNTFSSLPPRFVENKNTPARMISMNLCDKDARHLMVFVESPFYVPAVVDAITKYQEGMQIDSSKIKYLDNDQQPLASLVNNFVSYVQEGFTVILRNMEPLYPSLYDLFNQRYIPSKVDKKKVFCQITYGTTVSKVPVHSEFKCIILMDKPAPEDYRNFKDVEIRWPTALLNRFEKHILTLEDLVDSYTYSLVEQAKKTLAERKLSPELYIHNWSALLLESCIARQSESDKRSIQLPVNNHQQAIKDQILTNLEKTGAIVPSKKRNVHQSLLGRESSNQDEDVTKVEDLLKNLGELYNSNYIYFLHIEYVNPSEKSLRDTMFEKFLILQTSRSIQRLILDHQASRTSRQFKTEAFVAFSFAQPFGLSIRDLIDSDETLAVHRSQVELVYHPPYSTVEDRLSKATAALESPDNHTVIFQFRQADEWRHLEEYATVVRDFMGKYTRDKLVVLLAHNGSFAESDQNQFRFESIHFHSNLKPISLDIIGPDKSDLISCYELLDKSPLQLLTECSAGFIEQILGEALNQEFIYGKPYFQDQNLIVKMMAFARERDLIAQVFAAVIRESSNSIDHAEYEILAQANIKLVDQVEKGAVKDIVELFKKRLLPLVHRLLQLAVGEVHHRCDMFFGLRVFTRISQGSLTPEELNTLQRRLRLWEAVAKKVRIQSHDDDIYPSLRKIYTNKDSLQYPQTFFRNLIPKKMNQIDSGAVLEKDCRERVLGLFSKAIQQAPHPVSQAERGQILHKILETEVLPRISSITKLDAAVWTLEVDSSGDLQLLEDLILAMFPDIPEVCTFNHLLAYCGPLLESYQVTITRPVLLSEILSLTYAVALCFPAEVRLSKRFSSAVPVSTALLLRDETQETIWASLKLNSSEDQKSIFSEIVVSEIGIEDPRAQKLLMAELIRSSCSVNDAKLVVLQKYLAKIFSKIYSPGTTHEDREAMSSKAAACMPAFLDYGNLIFLHAACEKVACQTYQWLQAAMTLLGFAKDSYLNEGTQRRADNLTRDGLLQNLIGAVAHVVYSHSRLEVVTGQLLLQSTIANPQERQPLDDGLADFTLDQGRQ